MGAAEAGPVPVSCPHAAAPGRSARLPDGRGAGDPRRRPRHPGHLLAEGLHPAHDAVPRPVRLLHLRPAAGPPRRAVPHARRRCCALARAGARRRLPRGAVHPRRGAPRSATPWRPSGWPSTATTSTVDYLVAMCQLVLDETGLLPHANAGALSADELARLRAVSPVAGDDDRDAPRRPAAATAAHPTRPPSAASPPSRPPASWPSPSPPASSSASARTGPTASPPSRPSPQSHRRHGHVQEVIVQNFLPKPGTGDARRAALPARRLPRGHRPRPPDPPARDPPPGPAEPLRRLRRPARRRHRRLGRRLPRHRRPREPRAAVARPRHPPRGHRGPRAWPSPPASPPTPSTCSTPSAGSTRRCASR